MQLSVREAKARFTEAANAAVGGERVVITKHGKPFVEMVPSKPVVGIDWARAEELRRELGIVQPEPGWEEHFNDPAFSRRVLGLED